MIAPVITLDGPGGAGKGTLAGALAATLGWHLLDSGALYRVLAWYADDRGFDPQDSAQVKQVAAAAHTLTIAFDSDDTHTARVHCDGREVTRAIRRDAVSAAASRWAALPAIRTALLERQRAFCVAPGLIADGRDMGTTVFPQAPLKFYVTASAQERAQRRYAQMQATEQLSTRVDNATLSKIYEEVQQRDERDASRAVSPLQPAADAITIDTTGDSVTASLTKMRGYIRQYGWLQP